LLAAICVTGAATAQASDTGTTGAAAAGEELVSPSGTSGRVEVPPAPGRAEVPPAGAPLKVVASIHPISALVREVGGDFIEVSTIIPPGADPHHFELTPGKARALHEAKVIMLIGGHFDEWILPQAGEREALHMVITFSQAFTDSLIPLEDSFNPHFWLDPMFAREMARMIAVALCTADMENCEYYRARAAGVIDDLDRLRIAGRDRLAASGFEAFVSLHPAWTYFAGRFGLSEVATLEMSHESEPSARHIAGVIRKMTSDGIKFVIAEEFSGLDLAHSVAEQAGAAVILLDPLGDEDNPGRNTYAGLINHNISAIEKHVNAGKIPEFQKDTETQQSVE
jgi:zinc transport system substrate-binding protein